MMMDSSQAHILACIGDDDGFQPAHILACIGDDDGFQPGTYFSVHW